MNTKTTRLLSILLTATLLLCAIPVFAHAEEEPEDIATYFADWYVAINASNFPDDAFRNYVTKFDNNNDDVLDPSERAQVKRIAPEEKVLNYEGVKYFQDITEFKAFPNIPYDYLSFDSIEPIILLDFRFNTKLNTVILHSCKIKTLRFYNNLVLWNIGMSNAAVTDTLDFSGCPNLQTLNASNIKNSSLELWIPDLKNLYIYGSSNLVSLDVSGCPNLSRIDANNCNITSLDVSANPELTTLDLGNNRNLSSLELGVNSKLHSLKLNNTNLNSLNISGCEKLKETYANGASYFTYPSACEVICDNSAAVFAANNGSNETRVVYAEAGAPIIAPKCDFDAPEGMYFGGWKNSESGVVCQAEASLPLVKPTIFLAVWNDGTTPGQPEQPTDPEQPTQPDDPQPMPGNLCKWDNVDHGNTFLGKLTTFFHSIFYFFANLFGRK